MKEGASSGFDTIQVGEDQRARWKRTRKHCERDVDKEGGRGGKGGGERGDLEGGGGEETDEETERAIGWFFPSGATT